MNKKLLSGIVTAFTAVSIATPALAHDNGLRLGWFMNGKPHVAVSTNASASAQAHTAVDAACVKPAIVARETAVGTAWTAYASAVGAAYNTRRVQLEAAWSNSDASVRAQAELNAWNTFRDSMKNAHNAFKTAKKNAWSTFKTAAKACGAQGNASLGFKFEGHDRD